MVVQVVYWTRAYGGPTMGLHSKVYNIIQKTGPVCPRRNSTGPWVTTGRARLEEGPTIAGLAPSPLGLWALTLLSLAVRWSDYMQSDLIGSPRGGALQPKGPGRPGRMRQCPVLGGRASVVKPRHWV